MYFLKKTQQDNKTQTDNEKNHVDKPQNIGSFEELVEALNEKSNISN